jgi:hypothetical protein
VAVSKKGRTSAPAQTASQPRKDASKAVSRALPKFAQKSSEKASITPAVRQVVRDSINSEVNAGHEQRNLLARENLQKGGWKSVAPVLQQTSGTNCGAAAAAMLVRAKGDKKGVSDAQLVNQLDARYSTQEGTTPRQLSKMLATEGIKVKQGTAQFDKGALDGTLTTGGKAVAMVDSNKLVPGGDAKPAGKAHWVVIDGMDDRGHYMVKDPGNASSYFVRAETLAKAVDSTRRTNQSGGMLLVENAPPPATEVAKGTKKADALGQKPGTGSNTSRFGRESS